MTPEAARDVQTVDPDGHKIASGIDGVLHVRLTLHADHRGSLAEVIDLGAAFWEHPIVYSYRFSVAPGRIKGWGMHKLQDDRYHCTGGSLRTVLFDGRVDSPTYEHFDEHFFTPATPGLLYIPAGVWHASQSFGDGEAVVMNFPTRVYDHADPDKYRIDPHSGEIPFDFTLPDG